MLPSQTFLAIFRHLSLLFPFNFKNKRARASLPSHHTWISATSPRFPARVLQRPACGEKLNARAEKNYVVTTVVDPRYKFRFLHDKETAKKWLLDEMQVSVSVAITEQTAVETDQTVENARKAERATETSTKRHTTPNTTKTLKEEIHSDFMKCYEHDHDLSYSSSDDERSRSRQQGLSLAELVKEVDKYAVSPTI